MSVHTFVDESGVFIPVANRKRSFSCVGGLVVRSAVLPDLLLAFEAFKVRYGMIGEVKGTLLTETQIVEVSRLVAEFDSLLFIQAMDAATSTLTGLIAHRADAVFRATRNLTNAHSTSQKHAVHELATAIGRLSPQLYCQAVLTTELLHEIHKIATLYYVQRYPEELGNFNWEIDPKSDKPANRRYGNFDVTLRAVVHPWLMSASLKDPTPMLVGADYSHFKKYDASTPSIPEYLVPATGVDGPFEANDLGLMMRDWVTPQSKDSPGLQLADVFTNAVRRVLNGSLSLSALSVIATMIVSPMKGNQPIPMYSFNERKQDILVTSPDLNELLYFVHRHSRTVMLS